MWAKAILAHSTAKGIPLLVFVALGEYADKTGVFGAPIQQVAKICGVTERCVRQTISGLLKAKEIYVVNKGGGRSKPTLYQVTLPRETVNSHSVFGKCKTVNAAKRVYREALAHETVKHDSLFASRGRARNKRRAYEAEGIHDLPTGFDEEYSPFRESA